MNTGITRHFSPAAPGAGDASGRIRIGIIGGAGYTGGELIRLLIHHPQADIRFIHSRSQAGQPVYAAHPDLTGDSELSFSDDLSSLAAGVIDVLFLCLGHGESKKFLQAQDVHASIRVIDLANDFRLSKDAQLGDRTFVYGLPELNREQIRQAKYIANPGCFATTIQLGLLPLAQAGLLREVYTTGITGSTGAGQSLTATSHFSWRANNIQAYKTLTHQHLGEIRQSLQQLQGGEPVPVHFVPWRGDFTRGIFVSSTVKCSWQPEKLQALYEDYYHGHPFTHVSRQPIFLKQVVNTNKAIIQLEQQGDQLVVHSAIDNLLKGASGQAVQNMNLAFGLAETAGLELKPAGF